ncbi:hypothetical protein H2203_003500 [Taxawa tesnikishii (nom. ined.)]|nr:hypothetical protein H2203_003500 [Dothideales sp. JES 119]
MARTRNQDRASSAEPSKRSGRKRRASTESEVSVQVDETATSSQQHQVKRRRRHSRQEPEQTLEDVLELCEVPEGAQPEDNTIHVEPSSRHVRFSEGATEERGTMTATNITPHPRKTSIHRRITLSPSELRDQKPSQNAKSRASLPPSFSSSQTTTQEFHFVPLSQVIEERTKRRLRRNRLSEESNNIEKVMKEDAQARKELQRLRREIQERDRRVQALEYELETQRQLGIDVTQETAADRRRIKAMEDELSRLKEEIDERQSQQASLPQLDGSDDIDMVQDGLEDDDDDMLVLNSQEQRVTYPQLPATPSSGIQQATEIIASTQTGQRDEFPEDKFDSEREAFENAIKYWTKEASEAKATLQILTIELRNLGFGGPEANTEVIVQSIRQAFRAVREKLAEAFPSDVSSDVTVPELIDMVAEQLPLLSQRVRDHEQTIIENEQLRDTLTQQINGLLDRLTKAKMRQSTLEINNSELDTDNQENERYIVELEEKIKLYETDLDKVQAIITQQKEQQVALQSDKHELESTVKKLGAALDNYRKSEEHLQALITRMEDEHGEALVKMEKNHKQVEKDLQSEFESEASKRKMAEEEADKRQTEITELELRVEEEEGKIEQLKRQVAETEEAKAAEEEARAAAEADRNEKVDFITELEKKIEAAEADLEELRGELETLRELSESEKRQREAAETELDQANEKIGELEKKLHKQGVEANELRQKLFEIQMRETNAIKKLEAAAAEAEEHYQTAMSAEIARREQAESIAASRNVTIAELEEQLTALENNMRETLAEREDQLVKQAARADQLESELNALKQTLRTTTDQFGRAKAASDRRIADLEDVVAGLKTTVAEHEATISDLRAEQQRTLELHASATEERDAHIADLNHTIFTAQTRIQTLEVEKGSLEQRVEAEAEQMLELQASKDDEIAALKDLINEKQAEVDNLGVKAEEADKAWEAVMAEKNTEIANLTTAADQRALTIAALTKENAAIKDKFRKYVRDSAATSEAMKREQENALRNVAEHDENLHNEGQRVLEEIEAMDTVGELEGRVVGVKENIHVKRIKRTKNKRQYDSGIGVEDGDEAMAA